MSSTPRLDAIVALQESLDRLARARTLLDGIPDWMQELHGEYSERREAIEEIQAGIDQAASDRRAAEAEIADAQEKLIQYQDQIGRVRNQREYSALLQEIDIVKQAIQTHEESSLEALDRHESETARLEEERQAFAELKGRYNDELAKWEAQKPDVAANAESLKAKIAELREELSPGDLRAFDANYERFGGAALARIQLVQRPGKGPRMWHCSNCNYRVLPQALVEVRNNGSVVLCDSCKRILYFVESED